MKSNIILRPVTPEDGKQYVKLNDFVWRDAYSNIFPEEVFQEREQCASQKIADFSSNIYNGNGQFVYVAEDKGKIVGFIWGKLVSEYDYFKEKGYSELLAIYIHPDYQRMGIGSRLKQLFVEWLKKNDKNKFVIGVLKDNKKARTVYEKWGGRLHTYTQPFVKLGKEYAEVFYTLEI